MVFPTGVGMSRVVERSPVYDWGFPYRRRDEPWEVIKIRLLTKFSLQA